VPETEEEEMKIPGRRLAISMLTGEPTALSVDVKLNARARNDFRGDMLITTVTFTLNQDASQ
jgi:hypothetical protein